MAGKPRKINVQCSTINASIFNWDSFVIELDY